MQLTSDIANAETALAVDVDGMLVRSNLAIEAVLRLLRKNPFFLLLLPLWLLKGRAQFAAEVAARSEIDPAALPYDGRLVEHLRREKARGRRLVLLATSGRPYAEAISAQLGLFDQIVPAANTQGERARSRERLLDEACGLGRWSYPARPPGEVTSGSPSRARLFLKAARVHQWVKNVLIFAPLVLAHLVLDSEAVFRATLAFLSFGLCASSVYILNDLVDLEEDRRHPTKRNRPFASGALPLRDGIVMAPLLLAASFLVASALPWAFSAVLLTYYVSTLAYSFYVKRFLLWDVILLAGLYTLRIVAGSAALEIPRSFWLLAFSIFLFFSLAMVKRYVELHRNDGEDCLTHRGRSYTSTDLETLSQFGIASGLVSVLVLALYIDSNVSRALYRHPEFIWLMCPLMLYLIGRVWMLARRNEVPDDPVLFFVNDRSSQMTMGLGAILLILATF